MHLFVEKPVKIWNTVRMDKQTDQPLGVPPSEFHPQRPPAPFKKRGNVKTAILVGILIIILDLFIYFFLIKPDDSQLFKAIEPLKPPSTSPAPSLTVVDTTKIAPSQTKTDLATVTQRAKEDLAKRLNVDPASIKVVSEKEVTWNDGSMGCPQPEMMYTQALVEGSQVVLASGKNYEYHAGSNGKPFLCEKPSQ